MSLLFSVLNWVMVIMNICLFALLHPHQIIANHSRTCLISHHFVFMDIQYYHLRYSTSLAQKKHRGHSVNIPFLSALRKHLLLNPPSPSTILNKHNIGTCLEVKKRKEKRKQKKEREM